MTNPFHSPGIPGSSMAETASGFTPRRSSYASVVSGTASPSNQPPSRSGAYSQLWNENPANHEAEVGGGAAPPSFYDMSVSMPGTSGGRINAFGSTRLPSFSRAFETLLSNYDHVSSCGGAGRFFVPSYLRGTKYILKLQDSYRARNLAQKERQTQNTQPGTVTTTNPSHASSHTKGAASHRGITYDVIEKTPALEDEAMTLLPTCWNTKDKHAGLEILSDGQELRFSGGKAIPDRDHEASAVRADHPMPTQCGIYYFEISVSHRRREEQSIAVGFSSKHVPLSRLPGWEPESWAYHGDDGHSFCCQSSGKHYGPPFGPGDTVGCGVNFRTGSAFFTKNGVNLGTAFREIKGKLFPSVGMKKPGEYIRANFGQSAFVFDIDGMMALEKEQIRRQIEDTSFTNLVPGVSETELVQALALQYLTQEGYIETAKAFADEVYSDKVSLNLDPNKIVPRPVVKEDEDAGHRQRIRTAILDGDVDQALNLTNNYYPQVLKENENVSFRIKCRKFVEMIRKGAEMQKPSVFNGTSKKSNGHNGDWYDDVLNHDIDMDGHQDQNNFDQMVTEDSPDYHMDYQNLLQDTLAYGQLLQSEFKDDPRREVGKALEDAFALMAYQDPLNVKEVSYLLDPAGRVAVAEELNAAILLSLGKSSTTALEKMIQQTTVLLEILRENGGAGSFVNIDDYLKVTP